MPSAAATWSCAGIWKADWILDAGVTQRGRPFFVMELVRGVRITDYCDRTRLGPHDRLSLFIKVCHAIQHAHQKGIIHRDIKPTNARVPDGRSHLEPGPVGRRPGPTNTRRVAGRTDLGPDAGADTRPLNLHPRSPHTRLSCRLTCPMVSGQPAPPTLGPCPNPALTGTRNLRRELSQ